MGFNFHKSINLGNGVRLNLGKKSASVSVGRKGIRHTVSTTGRQTTTVSIPGTGISYSHTSGTKKAAKKKAQDKPKAESKPKTAAKPKDENVPAYNIEPMSGQKPKPKPEPEPAETAAPSNPFASGRAAKMPD